ncbi:hypothetical protein K1719_005025 [Acacia pycnantha]|nr:hypothetical protein K1719_005025 [Acacia pycnantha]
MSSSDIVYKLSNPQADSVRHLDRFLFRLLVTLFSISLLPTKFSQRVRLRGFMLYLLLVNACSVPLMVIVMMMMEPLMLMFQICAATQLLSKSDC